jgi:hypothetical protein
LLEYLHTYQYYKCRLTGDFSNWRQQLWRSYSSIRQTLRRLLRSEPMVQGSFYLQQRRCGKPNCRCTQGQLHGAWVITRSEGGKSHTYMVPVEERARLRRLTGEYRRYQRSRAVLVKGHLKLLELVDRLAEKRLINWPEKKTEKPP